MTTESNDPSRHLRFSQRYGYEPLPEPMRLEEISDGLRREIWNSFRAILLAKTGSGLVHNFEFAGEKVRFIERIIGKFDEKPESEVFARRTNEAAMKYFGEIFMTDSFNKTLDLLEIIFEVKNLPFLRNK